MSATIATGTKIIIRGPGGAEVEWKPLTPVSIPELVEGLHRLAAALAPVSPTTEEADGA